MTIWRRKWQPTPVFLPGKSHGQRNLAGYSPWGQPTPVFLPGKSHGQRNLAGYSPWGRKESEKTELNFTFLKRPYRAVQESACNAGDPGEILGSGRSPGEGNGNPLQYSCLENPMDRGIWQATVHVGVTKSQT